MLIVNLSKGSKLQITTCLSYKFSLILQTLKIYVNKTFWFFYSFQCQSKINKNFLSNDTPCLFDSFSWNNLFLHIFSDTQKEEKLQKKSICKRPTTGCVWQFSEWNGEVNAKREDSRNPYKSSTKLKKRICFRVEIVAFN